MVMPALGGYWIDKKLDTKAIFTLAGVLLGMVYGTWQLFRFAKQQQVRLAADQRTRADSGLSGSSRQVESDETKG